MNQFHVPPLLNDLLNISNADLGRTKVKFNVNDGTYEPINEFLRDRENFHTDWMLYRKEQRNFEVGDIAICLVRLPDLEDTWLLTTVMEITVEYGVENGTNYGGAELERLRPYFERVFVKYHNTAIRMVRNMNGETGVMNYLEVEQVLPNRYGDENFHRSEHL